MMKPISASAILALALAGSACSEAAHDDAAAPDNPPVVEASAPAEDSGFNLMYPGDEDMEDVSGFNLGIDDNAGADGISLPDDVVSADRLGDIGEITTNIGDSSDTPNLSPDLPSADTAEPEDDLIRLD